jgi:protocatechuate 3,4-dioxygenase beta subunit
VSTAIPEETAGPYPGDGSNGPNVLTQSGVVRSDIRSSFGSSKTTASGVPYTIRFQIVKVGTGAPIAGAAVYVWHCDKDGNYSMYSQGVTNENFLRGVQETDANGWANFLSVFPGCYSGRWPHVHFEVFPSLAKATTYSNKIATSQLALPEDIDKLVYATNGYSSSVRNLSQVTLKTDNVFSDGWTRETPTVAGNVTAGYTSTIVVPVKA